MKRPIINGIRKPLSFNDPIEWWKEEAKRLNISPESLREQVRLTDEILSEIISEEQLLNNISKKIKILINNGDVFEGSFDQFANCFFTFRGTDLEKKMIEIIIWSSDMGYTFTFTNN